LLKLQIEIFAFYLRNANAHSARFPETPTAASSGWSIWANNAKQIGYSNPQTPHEQEQKQKQWWQESKKGQEFRWGYNLCVWPPER